MVLAVLTGILAPVLWGTADFVLMVEVPGALVLLRSGSALLAASSCLARGYLTLAPTERIRRITLFCWVLTVVLAVLTANVEPPSQAAPGRDEHSAPAVFGHTTPPFVAVLLAGVNHFVGRALFPSVATLLRRFGPPPHWPPAVSRARGPPDTPI